MVRMALGDLIPHQRNPRKVSADALKRLTKSLHELGNLQPVVFNVRTGRLLGGHQRVKCLAALKRTETEVWCVDLDERKEAAALIALNKSAGEWDNAALKDLLQELDAGDIDMDLTGFGVDEIATLMEQFHVEGIGAPTLKDGDRAPFRQATFTLHDEQWKEVEAAMVKAKKDGGGESSVNENGNGNALAFICRRFNNG